MGSQVTTQHHDELFLAIGRLEGKVDSILAQQSRQNDELKAHDARIRSLEHSRGYMLGWSAAIGASMSIAANYLLKHFA
jgi:hypothetical protein